MKVAIGELIGSKLPPGTEYKVGKEYSNLASDFNAYLKATLSSENVNFTDAQIERLTNDMLAKSLNSGWLKKLNRVANESRGLYNILQLSPIGWLW